VLITVADALGDFSGRTLPAWRAVGRGRTAIQIKMVFGNPELLAAFDGGAAKTDKIAKDDGDIEMINGVAGMVAGNAVGNGVTANERLAVRSKNSEKMSGGGHACFKIFQIGDINIFQNRVHVFSPVFLVK
jgi:hypothetical protein